MKIVIKRIDGGVSLMSLALDASADDEVSRWSSANPGQYVSHRAMGNDAIPPDRAFRDAWTDTTPEAVIDICAKKAKEVLLRKNDVMAMQKRNFLVAGVSPAEMASWPIKLQEAMRFIDTSVESDAPNLAMESASRGVTLSQLANKVISKGNNFLSMEASISGASGKHGDAITWIPDSEISRLIGYDLSAGWPI